MRTLLLILALIFVSIQEARSCHATALLNYAQQQYSAGLGIQITADSDAPTCGCDGYWMDIEVRELGTAFDAAPFAPGFYGPLSSMPYYQSATMMKPDCVIQTYPWVTIPDSILCNGATYLYRLRENHNGTVGPWTPIQSFVATNGALTPFPASVDFSYHNVCLGDSIEFISSVTGQSPTSYNWYMGDSVSIQNDTMFNYLYTVPGTYEVSLEIGDGTGCPEGVVHTVHVNPIPIVDFSPSSFMACGEACISFVDLSTIVSGSIDTWLWDFDDGDTSHLQDPNHCYYNTGTDTLIYSPSLVLVSDSGCTDSVIHPLSVVVYEDFSPPVLTSNGTELYVNAHDSIQWYVNGNPIFGANDTMHIAIHNGHHYAIVWNEYGCSESTDSIYFNFSYIEEMSDTWNTIYPNPVSLPGRIYMSELSSDGSIKVFSVGGKLLYQGHLNAGVNSLELPQLPNGLVIIGVSGDEGVLRYKLIVE